MAEFKTVELFGGAIVADLPSTFEDVRYVQHNSSSSPSRYIQS